MGITGIPGIRLGIAWGAAPKGIPGRMGIPVPMGIPGIPGIGPAPGIENDAPCPACGAWGRVHTLSPSLLVIEIYK